ncbi:MAG: M24 family metallopeptidase [Planctomycetota bacterium]
MAADPARDATHLEPIEAAATLARETVDWALSVVAPGVVPAELAEHIAERLTRARAVPVLRGYASGTDRVPPFPAAACIGVNERVVNAVPTNTPLQAGDVVSVDLALSLDGWHADVADSTVVGATPGRDQLIPKLRSAMDAWLARPFAGSRPSEVASNAEEIARRSGLRLLPEHLGHGIGRSLHQAPRLPIPGRPATNDEPLRVGTVLAVELAAIELSSAIYTIPVRFKTLSDGWTRAVRGGVGATVERMIVLESDQNRFLSAVRPQSETVARDGTDGVA